MTRTEDPHPTIHGRAYQYRKGCRCEPCHTAFTTQHRQLRARRNQLRAAGIVTVPHGLGGYKNWGCRCPVCTREHKRDLITRRRKECSRTQTHIPADRQENDEHCL